MTRKIAALIAVLMLCLAFAGCSGGEEAPEGMKSVTIEGEPFKLYVPVAWTDNTASGISSAIYSPALGITVSARYHTLGEDITLTEAASKRVLELSASLEQLELKENNPASLGGKDAVKLIYTVMHKQVKTTIVETLVIHNSDLITLRLVCPTEHYEANAELYDTVADVFALCDKGEITNDCIVDKKTPAGMKIASADHLEYRLYVPQSWICHSESGRSEAYVSESGKPNVTVSFIAPGEEMTVEQYFAECEKQYKETISGYELLSSVPTTVASRDAVSYTYTAKYGETSFKVMQTVIEYAGRIYSITYTALEDSFEAHLDDVNSILEAFIFR